MRMITRHRLMGKESLRTRTVLIENHLLLAAVLRRVRRGGCKLFANDSSFGILGRVLPCPFVTPADDNTLPALALTQAFARLMMDGTETNFLPSKTAGAHFRQKSTFEKTHAIDFLTWV